MNAMDPGLREELLAMAATDQDARQRLDCHPYHDGALSEQALAAAEHLRVVDAANTARMKSIVAERGWPGRSLVGEDGAQAAWLLVQHADLTPPSSAPAWSCWAKPSRPVRPMPASRPT